MSIENNLLKAAAKLSQDLSQAKKGFTQNLITIATGFLALFVGLKPESIQTEIAKCFYFSTIILLVMGIVFSVISLYQEILYIRNNEKYIKQKMKEHLEGKGIYKILFNYTKRPWYFRAAEILGFLAFIMAAITLIFYIYFLEIA